MSVRKILIRSLAAVFALLLVALIFINGLIDALTRPLLADKDIPSPDYILVLGAGLNDDGSPGRMLRDRLNTAISLYERFSEGESAPKIIVSGDRSIAEGKSYDEVGAMRDYLLKKGIPESAVLEDPYGFSTAESVANLASLEEDAHIAVVTQEYHLYRALFIAYMSDFNVSGYKAPPYDDHLQLYRDLREIAARVKDFFLCTLTC